MQLQLQTRSCKYTSLKISIILSLKRLASRSHIKMFPCKPEQYFTDRL